MKKYLDSKIFWTTVAFLISPLGVNAQGVGWRRYMPEAEPFGLSEQPVSEILITIMLWLLGLIEVLSIIAFAISGVMYLTSAGDTNRMEQAKKYVISSIIGIVVSMLGLIVFFTVRSVLSNTGGGF